MHLHLNSEKFEVEIQILIKFAIVFANHLKYLMTEDIKKLKIHSSKSRKYQIMCTRNKTYGLSWNQNSLKTIYIFERMQGNIKIRGKWSIFDQRWKKKQKLIQIYLKMNYLHLKIFQIKIIAFSRAKINLAIILVLHRRKDNKWSYI